MNKANQSLQCPELGTACLPGEAFHGYGENLKQDLVAQW